MPAAVNGSASGQHTELSLNDRIPPFQNGSTPQSISQDGQSRNRVNPIDQISHGGIGHPPSFAALTSSAPSLSIYEKQYLPGQPIALSGIAIRAFALGIGLAFSSTFGVAFLVQGSVFWRPFFFAATLTVFHFLEFWTTAQYNTKAAQVSSFLLNQNGSAYTIAHAAAMAESVLTCLASTYLPSPNPISAYLFPNWTSSLIPEWFTPLSVAAGLLLVMVGQTARSLAMAQAGENFNHIVQARKATSHRLVTSGIYSISRHPSYWGFFWWGLGTQLVLGNIICFFGYAAVLWVFFKRRITGEEQYLVRFFGKEYLDYRARTGVWIPFIR